MDAKARINIGSFDRGGRNRVPTQTDDHDFKPKTTVAPYGIFLPELDELFLYFTESKVTSDFIVDILGDFWKSESWRFSEIKTLLINPKVLNVNKNPIKTAQNMLNFGRKIKVYLFDSDYKFISQDCQRYLERTAKKRLSGIEQSSVL